MIHRSLRATVLAAMTATSLALIPRPALPASTEEQGVREALALFKTGIDTGNRSLGSEMASGPFRAQFISFYDQLLGTYARYRAPIPLEVGHVKIRKDGRAKVEAYLNPGRDLVVFTLMRVEGRWKFYHIEGILLPLFDYPDTPFERMPQLPQERRGFMMAEKDLAFRSYVYDEIKKDRGERGAMDFFLDGPGFKTAMDAWLPFLEGAGQFAVFLAILESNYYGSKGVVTRATEDEAEVHFQPLRDLEVLKVAIFAPKFTPAEYESLYRHVMTDRAEACSLAVDVSIRDTDCILKVRKR